ncbi:sensor histidine kinase [Paenibacillus sp. OAS669]|uniref:cache domain-containing sensor histidine kinase n=1 Tax=Paenibacillus sp. OAS669 TaxID=2663821 RepID=UPI00178A4526|nr:sensor histidine kinase [Paenibacillus sp. OAS669]MBE1440658.1 two-component system sensor histidine kinase YesM [Paenibacillus sp. OAS669]
MRWLANRSLKSTILWLFVPLILVFVPVTGIVSYMLASQQLRANAETSINDTLFQTKNYMNDRLTALLTDLTALDNSSDIRSLFYRAGQPSFELQPRDYMTLSKQIDKVYSDFYTIIDSIGIYYNEGRIAVLRQDYLQMDAAWDVKPFLQYPYDTASQVYWLNIHKDELGAQRGANVAGLYKWVGGPRGDRTGLILIQLKEDFFRELLTAPKISNNGYLMLVSPESAISFKAAQSPYELDQKQLHEELQKASNPVSGRIDMRSSEGRKMVVLYDTIGINKWKIAAVYPQDEIYEKINDIQYVSLSVMAAVLIVVVLLSGVLANIIARPLGKLTRQIDRIEQGNLDVAVPERPSREIGILSKGIQDMLERIKLLLAQVEHEQEQKRLSELAALQAQIQPHFLYNTLFSIKQLCEMNETKEASQMITALSNYFRISISKGNEIISIANELEHVKQYLYIQHQRYGSRISYTINVPEELQDGLIVKLTLQPLVENAIYHGVKKIRRPGVIEITGWMDENNVYLRVKDNGAGMSPERLVQLENSLSAAAEGNPNEAPPVGFGVRNVHRRLQLHYGQDYGLSFVSEEGAGTAATVKIPLRRA